MSLNKNLLDIEIILQKPNPENGLFNMYRYTNEEGKNAFVLALIGTLIKEHEFRKIGFKG